MHLSTICRASFFPVDSRHTVSARGVRMARELPRRPGGRPGRRAARGGRRPPRAGVRARRGGHRQDPHDHPPDRAPRPHRARRAGAGPRRHVHRPRRRGDAHPAARARRRRGCRRAPSTPPRCASCATSGRGSSAASSGSCSRASCGSSGRRRAGRVRAPTPPSLRDLAGEIEWAKASLVTPGDYPAAVARLRRDIPGPAEQVAAVYAGYEEAQEPRRAARLRRPAAAHRGGARGARATSPRSSATATAASSSTSTRTSRRCSSACSTPGSASRDDLTVVGDANQTIYTFAGADPRHLLDFPRRFPEAVVVRLTARLPVHPAGRLRGQHADRRRPRPGRGHPAAAVGQLPARPGPAVSASTTTSPPRPRPSRARSGGWSPTARRPREIAVLFRVNAQSEVYEQALTEAGVPYQVRGGERFFARPEVRRAMSGGPRGRAGARGRAAAGRRARRAGARRPHRRAARRCGAARAVGVAARAGRARRGARRRRTGGRPAPVRRRARQPGGRRAPARPCRASRWRRCTRRRGWSGTPCSWSAWSTARCRSSTPRATTRAIEEERRLLYVGITRARRQLSLSWALSRQPGGGRRRRRSRFLYGLIPDAAPGVARSPTGGRGAAAAKPRCRVCGSPLLGTIAMKLRRCDDCPSDVDVELLDRLKDWRARAPRRNSRCPPTSCSPTPPSRRSPSSARRTRRRAGRRSPGSARASSTATAQAVLALVAEGDD